MLSATSVKKHRGQGKGSQNPRQTTSRKEPWQQKKTGQEMYLVFCWGNARGELSYEEMSRGKFPGVEGHPGELSQEKCLEPTISIGSMNIVYIKLCQ